MIKSTQTTECFLNDIKARSEYKLHKRKTETENIELVEGDINARMLGQ